jgi:hypothetical protein
MITPLEELGLVVITSGQLTRIEDALTGRTLEVHTHTEGVAEEVNQKLAERIRQSAPYRFRLEVERRLIH